MTAGSCPAKVRLLSELDSSLFCVLEWTTGYNDSVDITSSDNSNKETNQQKKNKHSEQTDML